ncbi:MAG TPA: hypothetical protein DCO72_02190 [Ruminococcus sp.]|nr:hypothetical protein [Ruminococcus sp.]
MNRQNALYVMLGIVVLGVCGFASCGKKNKPSPDSQETTAVIVSTAPEETKKPSQTVRLGQKSAPTTTAPIQTTAVTTATIVLTETATTAGTETEFVGIPDENEVIDIGDPYELPPNPEPVREIVVNPLKSPEYWKSTLSGDALALYDTLYTAFMNYETLFPINVDPQEVDIIKIADYVFEDHPEIFWYEYECQWYPLTLSFGHVDPEARRENMFKIELQNKFSVEQLGNARAELERKVAEILSYIPDGATPDDKVLYIHDYLVKYAIAVEHPEIYYNAYDCLVNRETMCNGYTKAFTLLMNQLDVQSGQVLGGSWPDDYHTWNYVLLDGNYYWIDVTWDDSVLYEALPADFVNHNYYCITDEQLLRNHTIDYENSIFIPQCVATDRNYFRTHGTFLETYHFDDFNQVSKEQAVQDCIQVQFSSVEQLNLAVNDLFMQNGVAELDFVKGKNTYWRYANEDTLTMIIYPYKK